MHNIRYYNFVVKKNFIMYLKTKVIVVAKQELKKEITLFN